MLEILDTTLRDGAQQSGVALTLDEKLRIVSRLDEFGIDIIEGGFPASNPKDQAFFAEAAKLQLSHARLAAFVATCRKDTPAEADSGLWDAIACGAPVVVCVGKAWDLQVTEVLRTTGDENLRMISESVTYLTSAGREVVFDAEHFFDGLASNAEYALACVVAAAQAGAACVCLCDTNGGSLPSRIVAGVKAAREALDGAHLITALGIHCHNDAGLAVANALAAVEAGVSQVQGTINGYGERVGNTDLLTVIANLELKMGYTCVGAEALQNLTSVSRFVAEMCNKTVKTHHPYVGTAAFAHKGGLHGAAETRMTAAYEHEDPRKVGNTSQMVVSELAGKASLIAKVKTLGFNLEDYPDSIQHILDEIKAREAAGYSYEVADGSLMTLIMRNTGNFRAHFALESFRVIVDDYEDTGAFAKDALSEATIKIHVGSQRFVATAEGDGPVGALDNALRTALREFYPQLDGIELVDFKVRILDGNVGTDATTRVAITTRDQEGSWGTIGVSANMLEASWNALVDSIEYGLMRAGVAPVSE